MKKIIIKILQILAKRVVKKYNPKVVAITGSVGKTATKEAIFAVLEKKFFVRKNQGNYNTEIGLPLTVIGCNAPGKNPFKWIGIYLRAFSLLIIKHKFPEILVLEMGADKPGDISELVSIAKPTIAIITAVSATHTEQFNSISGIIREKGKLFRAVDRNGWIIVNKDRSEVCDIAEKCEAKKIYIGKCISDNLAETNLNICASEISISMQERKEIEIAGTSFKLHTDGKVIPVLMKGIIGAHWVYPALFAGAVARILGVHMVDVAEGLREIMPQPGRMRILSGIKNTILIDDTYNSSPNAVKSAIEALESLQVGNKKYAVLGDMLELGPISEEEHKKTGSLVAKNNIDYLVTIGERARDIARGAKSAKMPKDKIFEFDNNKDAGLFIQKRLEEGDIVLVKGSRSMHLEEVTKEIMLEPEKAGELLVH